jgi:hypothetical protein
MTEQLFTRNSLKLKHVADLASISRALIQLNMFLNTDKVHPFCFLLQLVALMRELIKVYAVSNNRVNLLQIFPFLIAVDASF